MCHKETPQAQGRARAGGGGIRVKRTAYPYNKVLKRKTQALTATMNETFITRLTTITERGLKALFFDSAHHKTTNESKNESQTGTLSKEQRQQSIRLIRVNHAGEICAQALYNGQALFSQKEDTYALLLKWGEEEQRHLQWCSKRLGELGGNPSRLNLFWYSGSFFLGCLIAPLPKAYSMGFIAETERQVMRHLKDHIQKLPSEDQLSIDLLERICDEEADHCDNAVNQGAQELPWLAKKAMLLASQVFREVSLRV